MFWSLGSAIAVHLNAFGWPYWANILVVGVSCYTTLFAVLPLLTPVVETLGKNVTNNIWIWVHETTFERKRTLFPLKKDLLVEEKVDQVVMTSDEESLKGKGKEKETEREEKSAAFDTEGVEPSS